MNLFSLKDTHVDLNANQVIDVSKLSFKKKKKKKKETKPHLVLPSIHEKYNPYAVAKSPIDLNRRSRFKRDHLGKTNAHIIRNNLGEGLYVCLMIACNVLIYFNRPNLYFLFHVYPLVKESSYRNANLT